MVVMNGWVGGRMGVYVLLLFVHATNITIVNDTNNIYNTFCIINNNNNNYNPTTNDSFNVVVVDSVVKRLGRSLVGRPCVD